MMSLGGITLVLALGAGLVCTRVRRFGTLVDAPRDVLVCVAHSDDCVIMGAEYAYGALRSGHTVQVVYLTCGAADARSEMATTRRREAITAWADLNVAERHLTFLNLRESPVRGPAAYTPEELWVATATLAAQVSALPANAAVLVPANGESHIDHRTVRHLALQAIVATGRGDLAVYESPTYNPYLSLIRAPERTMRTILRHIPILTRFIQPPVGSSRFVDGPCGAIFRDTPERLVRKRALLHRFASQDPATLVRSFGHPTPYRAIVPRMALGAPPGPGGIPCFGRICDWSALAWALAIWCLALVSAYELGLLVSRAYVHNWLSDAGIGFAGVTECTGYLIRWRRRTVSLETALFACAPGIGLLLALI